MADSGRSPAPGPGTIGPYTVLGELGRGGMGTVYRARVVAALNHPNIAAIYAIEDGAAGIQALVLELVEGKSLATRIAEGGLVSTRWTPTWRRCQSQVRGADSVRGVR